MKKEHFGVKLGLTIGIGIIIFSSSASGLDFNVMKTKGQMLKRGEEIGRICNSLSGWDGYLLNKKNEYVDIMPAKDHPRVFSIRFAFDSDEDKEGRENETILAANILTLKTLKPFKTLKPLKRKEHSSKSLKINVPQAGSFVRVKNSSKATICVGYREKVWPDLETEDARHPMYVVSKNNTSQVFYGVITPPLEPGVDEPEL